MPDFWHASGGLLFSNNLAITEPSYNWSINFQRLSFLCETVVLHLNVSYTHTEIVYPFCFLNVSRKNFRQVHQSIITYFVDINGYFKNRSRVGSVNYNINYFFSVSICNISSIFTASHFWMSFSNSLHLLDVLLPKVHFTIHSHSWSLNFNR